MIYTSLYTMLIYTYIIQLCKSESRDAAVTLQNCNL